MFLKHKLTLIKILSFKIFIDLTQSKTFKRLILVSMLNYRVYIEVHILMQNECFAEFLFYLSCMHT